MASWDSYTQKATPEDNDTLMIKDTAGGANKRTPFSGVWNWIVGKLTSAVVSQLETTNKSIVPAINELNSKSNVLYYNYYQGGVDVDEKMSILGGSSVAVMYFGGNLINPPDDPNEWSYFSVIVINTRAFAFSPSNPPGALAFRQNIDGVWRNWIYK